MTYERVDHPVEPLTHPLVPEQPLPAYRSVLVDDREWLGGGFERPRERTAEAVRQPTEDPYEYQEPHDDQVAEEHVEQQLPVGPLRAVRRPAQLGHRGRVQQTVERLSCLLHLVAHDLSIHLMTSLPKPSYRREDSPNWRFETTGCGPSGPPAQTEQSPRIGRGPSSGWPAGQSYDCGTRMVTRASWRGNSPSVKSL